MSQPHEAKHFYKPCFGVTLLPREKRRRGHNGTLIDHGIIFTPGGTIAPLLWRMDGKSAGYFAVKMAGLVSDPEAIDALEVRSQDKDLTPEARVVFTAMVNTARRKTQNPKTSTP